jgi:hypothetical protein
MPDSGRIESFAMLARPTGRFMKILTTASGLPSGMVEEQTRVLGLLQKQLEIQHAQAAITKAMRVEAANAAEADAEIKMKAHQDAQLFQEGLQEAAHKRQLADEEAAEKRRKGLKDELALLRVDELKAHGRTGAANKLERDIALKKEQERLQSEGGLSPEAALEEAKRRQHQRDRAGTIDARAPLAAGAAWGLDHRGASALDAAKLRNARPWGEDHPGLGMLPHRGPAGAAAAAANAAAHKPDAHRPEVVHMERMVELQKDTVSELKRLSD